MRRLLVVHGPNLSQLGTRDPAQYGTATGSDVLAAVTDEVAAVLPEAGLEPELCTDDHEGGLVERLHAARGDGTAAVIINPGALTHYSWALHDALELLTVPVVEVHLSQTHAREPFRRHSVVSSVADVTITGAGVLGYRLAVRAVAARLPPGERTQP